MLVLYSKLECGTANCNNKCRCSGKVKTFLIRQSCSGNMFVGLILMELLQWWKHVPVFKKVHELASKIKDTHLCHTQMCACQRNFTYFLKIVLDSTTISSIPSNLEACTPACFKEHCVNSTHGVLFHPSARWLSKRKCSKLRLCMTMATKSQ